MTKLGVKCLNEMASLPEGVWGDIEGPVRLVAGI
jgi:hypothetical protein